MKELSLNVLDIAENSVSAKASLVEISISEDVANDQLKIEIKDNGCGMSPQFLERVTDPFTTTRTTRKVGMGIPLLKEAAESTGGTFLISSTPGVGTCTAVTFGYGHIDRAPLGDMAGTIATLIQCHPDTGFLYQHSYGDQCFVFSTKEMKEILGDVSFGEPEVALWMREYLDENIKHLYE